jgi:uncharacterized BrkB/YihY/UPF0761 family membrane protein
MVRGETPETPPASQTEGDQSHGGSRSNRVRLLFDVYVRPRERPLPPWLAKYQDAPFVKLGLTIMRRDRESAGALVGSAIAFRVFQFFVPFLLFVVGVAAIISDASNPQDVNSVTGVSGGLAAQVRTAFTQHPDGRWVATLLGLWGIAATGRSLSRALFAASAVAWRLPTTNRAPLKVLGSIAGFVFVIGLVVVLTNRVRIALGYGLAGFSFIPAVLIYTSAWLGVLYFLPRSTEDPGALLPGSTLVGLTIAAMQWVSQLYLPGRLARAGELYGSIGTTVVVLTWFFVLGRVIALAMVLNPVIYEQYGSLSTRVFGLPVLRGVARRSHFLQRFFDLNRTQR